MIILQTNKIFTITEINKKHNKVKIDKEYRRGNSILILDEYIDFNSIFKSQSINSIKENDNLYLLSNSTVSRKELIFKGINVFNDIVDSDIIVCPNNYKSIFENLEIIECDIYKSTVNDNYYCSTIFDIDIELINKYNRTDVTLIKENIKIIIGDSKLLTVLKNINSKKVIYDAQVELFLIDKLPLMDNDLYLYVKELLSTKEVGNVCLASTILNNYNIKNHVGRLGLILPSYKNQLIGSMKILKLQLNYINSVYESWVPDQNYIKYLISIAIDEEDIEYLINTLKQEIIKNFDRIKLNYPVKNYEYEIKIKHEHLYKSDTCI